MSHKGRAIVAMSGGVDSSVVAACLHAEGYDVVGITLRLYDAGVVTGKSKTCCAGQDIEDAARVAETMGFRHYVLDYESKFKQSVIDNFADTYLRGETPIPCVRCNQTVKFQDLLDVARDLGGDFMATGHYVERRAVGNGWGMFQGKDTAKDQSYFLFTTTREQLDFLRFPLGAQTKAETRELARKINLPLADKPDSQDICFVPDGNYARLVERIRPEAKQTGVIKHLNGQILGEHQGIIHYTVGQRKGLGISHPDPLYVIKLIPETNTVLVGPESALGVRELVTTDTNWLGDGAGVPLAQQVQVKIRSTRPAVGARLFALGDGQARVVFDEPQHGVSPGQACVFYDGSRLIGGGWIRRD
jgi:tRNA-uridine 2-sulfurtransferase